MDNKQRTPSPFAPVEMVGAALPPPPLQKKKGFVKLFPGRREREPE